MPPRPTLWSNMLIDHRDDALRAAPRPVERVELGPQRGGDAQVVVTVAEDVLRVHDQLNVLLDVHRQHGGSLARAVLARAVLLCANRIG